MPGSLGRLFGRVGGMLGPLLTTVAPVTGPFMPAVMGTGLAMDVGSGVEGMTNPQPQPTLPSIKAPALSAAPMPGSDISSLPTPAGSGLTLSGGGAGPSTNTGAGVSSPDVMSQAIASAMGAQGAFGQYGGYGYGA